MREASSSELYTRGKLSEHYQQQQQQQRQAADASQSAQVQPFLPCKSSSCTLAQQAVDCFGQDLRGACGHRGLTPIFS